MKRSIVIITATLAISAAFASTASAMMHAGPGQHWVHCGRVLGHRVGVTQPGTSCSLGRNGAYAALQHHPSFWPRSYYGPAYSVRAYSDVTHKWYWLSASGSYKVGELGIWNYAANITISVEL